MSTQIKAGRRPRSQKPIPVPVNVDNIFAHPLELDPEMKKVIEEKGNFALRWLNYKHFIDMGGHDQYHWRPIRKSEIKELGYANIDLHSFTAGSSPDADFIRRGDLILAVRSKAIHEQHKKFLEQQNKQVEVSSLNKAQAEDARNRYGRGSGLTVHEGWQDDYQPELDDNEDSNL